LNLSSENLASKIAKKKRFVPLHPGERMVSVTGRFLDATLQQMPNRRRGIEAGPYKLNPFDP
jgi:hypothetical protein